MDGSPILLLVAVCSKQAAIPILESVVLSFLDVSDLVPGCDFQLWLAEVGNTIDFATMYTDPMKTKLSTRNKNVCPETDSENADGRNTL